MWEILAIDAAHKNIPIHVQIYIERAYIFLWWTQAIEGWAYTFYFIIIFCVIYWLMVFLSFSLWFVKHHETVFYFCDVANAGKWLLAKTDVVKLARISGTEMSAHKMFTDWISLSQWSKLVGQTNSHVLARKRCLAIIL